MALEGAVILAPLLSKPSPIPTLGKDEIFGAAGEGLIPGWKDQRGALGVEAKRVVQPGGGWFSAES